MSRSDVFGRLGDGTAVHRHLLGSDELGLEVIEHGAVVHRLHVSDGRGERRNVALGHATLEEYVASTAFFGATVGRYANRLAGGRFPLDGREIHVATNESGNTLHGGPDGFDKRVWETVDVSDTAVTLRLTSPDGDQGFPGTLTTSVTFSVTGGELGIDFEATTDALTVVSLTNHTYVNLDGEGEGSIDDHVLTVRADRYTELGSGSLPTGRLVPVDGTPLDLRAGGRLGDVVRGPAPVLESPHGLDHNFVIPGEGLRHAATLASPASGLALEVHSDRPGLQVYTGNKLDGSLVGTSGRRYRQGDGVALESQAFPDSPNHPSFPSTELAPGEVYRASTRWRFTATN